jgi:hypothetical protein
LGFEQCQRLEFRSHIKIEQSRKKDEQGGGDELGKREISKTRRRRVAPVQF